MNKEQLLIEITKELQLYNKVSLHTLGNISDLLNKWLLSEFENFYFDSGEDYNLWDEEIEPYPAQRILDAMKKKVDSLK